MKALKKIYPLLSGCALLLLATTAQAQNDSTQDTHLEENRMQFGFILGLNSPQFNVNSTSAFRTSTSIRTGFLVGISGEYNVSKRFSAGLQFMLAHNHSTVNLHLSDTSSIPIKVLLASVDLKLHMRYKLLRSTKHSPYIIGGVGVSKLILTEELIYDWNRANSLQTADIGFGWQFKNDFFFCNPELVFSHGLNSLGQGEHIASVDWNSITLSVYFKG